jgi:hypothetical protein
MAFEGSERLALFVRYFKPSVNILDIERSTAKENKITPFFSVLSNGFVLGDGECTLEIFVDFSTLQPVQNGSTAGSM